MFDGISYSFSCPVCEHTLQLISVSHFKSSTYLEMN
jgi:hypothetical protein